MTTAVAAPEVPRFRYTPAGSADPVDPFDPRPRLSGPANGRVSVDRLAVYFGLPGLTRDLYPVPPWVGVDRERPVPPRPAGSSDPAEFTERFRAAVAAAVADHERVAVAASGGLDSAALVDTVARLCRRDGRRLTVVVLDIADDLGRRTHALVAAQLEFLRAGAELVPVAPRPSAWPEPGWDPAGPRFDAWPRLHAGLVLSAADRGATVLLQGNGADQLLQMPPYASAEFARRGRWHAGRRYRSDQAGRADRAGQPDRATGPGELLAAVGRIRGATTARLYWATAWPGFTTDRGAPLVAGERLAAVRRWLASFQDASLDAVAGSGATWAEAVLLHRLFPYDELAPSGELPERMPFLDPAFASYAYHLPVLDRFDPDQPNAYLRGKGLVAGLLPPGIETVLAPRRQRCYQTYRRYWQAVRREPVHCVELGLVRPDWRRHCRDAFDLAMVMSCETWITGALERGAVAERCA